MFPFINDNNDDEYIYDLDFPSSLTNTKLEHKYRNRII